MAPPPSPHRTVPETCARDGCGGARIDIIKRISMNTEKAKCERCGEVKDLFQYTHFEADKIVEIVVDNGASANPRYTTKRENIAERRGLCKECAVEINKKEYDIKHSLQ